MNPDFPRGDAVDLFIDRLGNMEFIDDDKHSEYQPGFLLHHWWRGIYFAPL